MAIPYNILRSEVIEQINAVDRVYVRLALASNDAEHFVARSLLIDVFPQVWLDNPGSILSRWLPMPFLYEYDRVGAVFFSDFVVSKNIQKWFSGGECWLESLDTRPGYRSRVLPFDMPKMYEGITALRHPSYGFDDFIPMPWPHTVYTFTLQGSTNQYRSADFEPLVAPDSEYFENFAVARAEVVHGVSDSSQFSRFHDEVVVRVVDARAWLNEVRIGQDTLTATVHGIKVLGCRVVLSGSPGVRRHQDIFGTGAVTIPIPSRLPSRLVIALTFGQEELDRAVYIPGTFVAAAEYSGLQTTSRQVAVEREEGIEIHGRIAGFVKHEHDGVFDRDDVDVADVEEATFGAETVMDSEAGETSKEGLVAAVELAPVQTDAAPEMHPKVFISYSHDTAQHARNVLALAERLRRDGIDCSIDQYEESPAQGWPRWMEDQIEWANFILVVCTQTYNRRFRGKEVARKGLGATWEGAILTQELYNQATENTAIIPVVLEPEDVAYIPTVLQGQTYYNVTEGPQYTKLYRRLTNQPRIVKPPLGEIKRLSQHEDE